MRSFYIGDGTIKTGKEFWKKLDKLWTFIICTDGNQSYHKIIPKHKTHIVSKSETCLVESFNARLRHYIPCLKRRTMCYAKSLKTIEMAMNFFLHRKQYDTIRI